ncbi:MAG: hypothetical protein JU82_08790 [Sulfuricurvum sp. MLSB]|uniref:hypothetical protein n=1 Tax=Sulfuricurvum sp. MLSB TaxID=1537917 RepID=UPI00050164F9|nr:hypothetical protein [Sulfuricurvum sp. MLSB]KFN39024.1 MAG: hypothetical protein JU82_08790 [Sulfuricurvum sp. MLSB]
MKKTALELKRLIEERILELGITSASFEEYEIDGLIYQVDYKATIETKEGLQSGDRDVPHDSDELTVVFSDLEVRDIWNDMEPANENLKAVNWELWKLV